MTDDAFMLMIRAAVMRTSIEQMAEGLRVSRPTVRRWSEGKNLPHAALRPSVERYCETLK